MFGYWRVRGLHRQPTKSESGWTIRLLAMPPRRGEASGKSRIAKETGKWVTLCRGTLMPATTMNGKAYQMQELGFFSWYFNKETDPSLGTGSKFSSNGAFLGPAKSCPPGGTN